MAFDLEPDFVLIRLDREPSSSAGAMAAAIGAELIDRGGRLRAVDVLRLPGQALRDRLPSDSIASAVGAIAAARVIVLAWSGGDSRDAAEAPGLLQSLLDRLPEGALRGKAVIVVAAGVDGGTAVRAESRLRAVARVAGAIAAPTAVRASGAGPAAAESVTRAIVQAADEAVTLAGLRLVGNAGSSLRATSAAAEASAPGAVPGAGAIVAVAV